MPKSQLSVALLVQRHSSPSLALLLRDIFLAANQLTGEEFYQIELIGLKKEVLRFGPILIEVKRPRKHYDYILIPPAAQPDLTASWDEECRLIQHFYTGKSRIASACLGVFLLAKAGIMDGRVATTHWAWLDYAQQHFPEVRWDIKSMICEDGGIITAGGYLAIVDLALYLIAHHQGKKIAHELGRLLLAESVRERQSIYATQLIANRESSSPFHGVQTWIDRNLQEEITVSKMAEVSHMSLRNFQRLFTQTHGVSPRTFLQLKRIEKAKSLLQNTRLSVDEVVNQVGVNDVSSFRKLFQREVGLTPAEFRKRIFINERLNSL